MRNLRLEYKRETGLEANKVFTAEVSIDIMDLTIEELIENKPYLEAEAEVDIEFENDIPYILWLEEKLLKLLPND